MTDQILLREDQQGVATLTLNRPGAYNSLSLELMNALLAELHQIGADETVRAVIVRGSGRGFCAGHDLKEITSDGDADLQERTFRTCSELMLAVTRLPQPVIAQVHGIATAAGCQLVATCDLAVASDNSRFATPGVNIGLFCSTPMVALTRAVPRKQAMEMLLLGDMISAERALEIGLINRVVEESELSGTVQAMAAQIASKSALTIRTGKAAFYHQLNQNLDSAYQHCSTVMTCNLNSEDAREGIDAFLNKRQPVWRNR